MQHQKRTRHKRL